MEDAVSPCCLQDNGRHVVNPIRGSSIKAAAKEGDQPGAMAPGPLLRGQDAAAARLPGRMPRGGAEAGPEKLVPDETCQPWTFPK